MNRTFTKLLVLVGLGVAFLSASAFGATVDTVTYWNNDLANNSTKDNLTMTAGTGCSFSGGRATTTASTSTAYTGLVVDLSADSNAASNITVLVKYSGFEQGSDANNSILGILLGEDNELLIGYSKNAVGNTGKGLKILSGVTSSASGYLKGNAYAYADGFPAEGALMVTVVGTATAYKGVFIYLAQKNDDGTYKPFNLLTYWNTSSDFTDATKFLGVRVGGSISKIGSYHRPKMVIEGVAINYGISNRIMFPNDSWSHTTSGYVKKSEQLFLENMSLSVLSNALFTAYANGSSMDIKDAVASGYLPTYTVSGGTLTSMTRRFCAADSLLKTVVVSFSQKGNDIYYKADSAGYVNGRTTDPETVSSWTGGTVAESATAVGYAFHDITASVPFTQVADVSGSKNWSAIDWKKGTDRSTSASKPSKDTDVVGLILTDATILTMNESATMGLFQVVSDAMLTVKYTGTSIQLSSRVLDFSDSRGKIRFDCSDLTVSGSVTLMSGVIRGMENIDVAGSSVPEGVSLVVTENAIKLSAAQWTNGEGDNDITKTTNWRNGYVPFADGVFTDDFSLGADANWTNVTFAAQTESRVVDLNGYKVTFAGMSDSFGTIEFRDGSEEKTGELALATGTTKLWSGFSTDEGLRVRVASGATLDLNGIRGTLFKVILSNGATLTNTGADIGSGVVSVGGGIELDEGATANIVATKKISLAAPDFDKWTLDLSGGRLVKSGSAALEFENAYLQGPGTLDMQVKQITFGSNGFGMSDDAVIYLAKDQYTYPAADVTVSNLAGEGIVGNKNYIYTVTKSFGGLLTSDAKGVVLTDGVTLDLRENSGTYAWLANMSIADGAAITINLAGRDVGVNDKIISWSSKPDAKFWLDEATQKKGIVAEVREDGLYLEKAEGLVIGVR